MSPGLSQDYKLLIELWVPNQGYCQSVGSKSVVKTVSFQLEDPSLNPIDRWIANFSFPLYEICIQNQWEGRSIKF